MQAAAAASGWGSAIPMTLQEIPMHADRGQRPPMRPNVRKFANLELAGIAGDGTFSGYASVFGEVDLGRDAPSSVLRPPEVGALVKRRF